MSIIRPLSLQMLKRLPKYHSLLKHMQSQGTTHVSSPVVARLLGQSEIQVRKDLAAVSMHGGKPRTGFEVAELISAIGQCLGYDNINDAVLVGAGSLGSALLSYQGFAECGVNLLAGFDVNPEKIGYKINGRSIMPLEKLAEFCHRTSVHIGIITVPAPAAQEVCDRLVDAGILAIWNFAPVHLEVPPHILLENENMAISLSVLSQNLANRMLEEVQ